MREMLSTNITIKYQARWVCATITLDTKCTLNIFPASAYVCPPSIFSDWGHFYSNKIFEKRNLKQLSLTKTHYVFRGVTFIYFHSSLTYSRDTNKILTRKKLGPTNYLWEKISDPLNTHEKFFCIKHCKIAQWPETQHSTNLRNLAHSFQR